MPAGRPSKYDPSNNKQVEKFAKLGATDVEIADFLGIAQSTFYEWIKEYPELSEAIKRGKEIADSVVAEKLFKRATGYKHPDTHFAAYEGNVIATPTIKHYPPDTTAAIFWLKNRRPKEWRDKQEIEQTGGITIKFEEPSDYTYPSQDKGDNGIPESV